MPKRTDILTPDEQSIWRIADRSIQFSPLFLKSIKSLIFWQNVLWNIIITWKWKDRRSMCFYGLLTNIKYKKTHIHIELFMMKCFNISWSLKNLAFPKIGAKFYELRILFINIQKRNRNWRNSIRYEEEKNEIKLMWIVPTPTKCIGKQRCAGARRDGSGWSQIKICYWQIVCLERIIWSIYDRIHEKFWSFKINRVKINRFRFLSVWNKLNRVLSSKEKKPVCFSFLLDKI